MGGMDWNYVVPYQEDIDKALQDLRQDVFRRGKYKQLKDAIYGFSELDALGFSTTANEQERQSILAEYGAQALNVLIERVGISGLRAEVHSLSAAPKLSSLAEMEALLCLSTEGTKSILDIHQVASEPRLTSEPHPGVVVPLAPQELLRLFGTEKPTRKDVESNPGYWDDIGRGEGIYIIAYEDNKPQEIFFAGYSYD